MNFESYDCECLQLLVKLFKTFGLATFSINFREKSSEPIYEGSVNAVFYNCLLILLSIVMNTFAVLKLASAYRTVLTLFHIIDFLQIIFGSFVASFILAFYCYHQKTSLMITRKIFRMKLLVNQLNSTSEGKDTILVGFVILQLAVVFCLLSSALVYYENFQLLLGSGFRNSIVTWLLVQYGLVIRILLDMFRRLNRSLRSFEDVKGSTSRLQLLSSVRDLHYLLLETSQEVVRFYELVVLGCVAYVFACMIVFAYFLICLLIERRIPYLLAVDYVHFFLWLFCFSAALLLLSINVTRTTEEIKKTGMIVHRLLRGNMDFKIVKELKDFSRYLLHVRIKFTAWGFFSLDGSLVKSIFSSITTYLVILIQFQMDSPRD